MKKKTIVNLGLVLLAGLMLTGCQKAGGTTAEEPSLVVSDQTSESEIASEVTVEEEEGTWVLVGMTIDSKVNWYNYGKKMISEYEYDDKGNLIKSVSKYEDGSYMLGSIIEMEYDEDGDMLKSTTYDEDGTIVTSSEYVWNKDKTECTVTYHDASGKANQTISQSYNADKKLIKAAYETSYTEFIYDDHNNLKETISYSLDGSITGKCEYQNEYDENDRLVKATYVNYFTDETGNLYQPGGDSYSVMEYDDNGNLAKETSYSVDDDSVQFINIYEYEKH